MGGKNEGSHTILLVQSTQHKGTRTYMEYETMSDAIDGVCTMFENRLKELNPTLRNITYDITDLYNYVDQMADMSALVWDGKLNAYVPCDKEWIKKRAYSHLMKQAA
eukprot:TRINITY_DN256_c1_g1_i1.p4 TRINITY_DN256_c1_g1~~TRINITY_DN256_c1_g1_i1.p4  ORF type:complete len:107 (-),score=5.51 TRINITY_DN256_c1_g1_i1:439-759(-)